MVAAREFYALIAIGMVVMGCGAIHWPGYRDHWPRGGAGERDAGAFHPNRRDIRTFRFRRGRTQVIVSRTTSGDIAGVLEHVAPAARAALIEASRGSFAAGFTSVLIVAGGIAALGALLTVLLVSAVETGAARLPGGAASRLPGAA